jgi:hypothetical protein
MRDGSYPRAVARRVLVVLQYGDYRPTLRAPAPQPYEQFSSAVLLASVVVVGCCACRQARWGQLLVQRGWGGGSQ